MKNYLMGFKPISLFTLFILEEIQSMALPGDIILSRLIE
jgi:hypothetical protein